MKSVIVLITTMECLIGLPSARAVAGEIIAPQAAPVSVAVATPAPRLRIAAFSVQGASGDPLAAQLKNEAEHFAKLSLVFDAPASIARVEVQSCEREWSDGLDFFFWPGFRRASAEPGRRLVGIEVPEAKTEPVRSVAIVFNRNERFCVKQIKITDLSGRIVVSKPDENSTRVEEFQLTSTSVAAAQAASAPLAAAGLTQVIDHELVVLGEEERNWIFRFRSDGTYFIRGFHDDIKEASAFSSLGGFRFQSATKESVRLALHGLKAATAIPWDGVLCPLDCGGAVGPRDRVVDDVIEIEATKSGATMIRNRTSRSKRALPFSDMKAVSGALEN